MIEPVGVMPGLVPGIHAVTYDGALETQSRSCRVRAAALASVRHVSAWMAGTVRRETGRE